MATTTPYNPDAYPDYNATKESTSEAPTQPFVAYSTQSNPDWHQGHCVLDSGKMIRLGFIRKVYGILMFQMVITVGTVCFFMFYEPARTWIVKNIWFMWVNIVLSILVLIGLFFKRQSHPLNMILLVLWTFMESLMIGTVCGAYSCTPETRADGTDYCAVNVDGQRAIAQAFGITALIFVCLTVFTIQSKIDFSFLGLGLSVALMVLIFWGFFIWIFDAGWTSYYLYSLFGAIIFALYIVYDTWLLTKRLSPDEYILAAINLYLDVINLFLFILALLGGGRRD